MGSPRAKTGSGSGQRLRAVGSALRPARRGVAASLPRNAAGKVLRRDLSG
jgi:hypothetical protein